MIERKQEICVILDFFYAYNHFLLEESDLSKLNSVYYILRFIQSCSLNESL